MKIRHKQLAGSIRTAVLLSAGLALVAMTSGLLLAIHVNSAGHSADHDSYDCSICQQLVVASKKIMLVPSVELVHDSLVFREDVPAITQHVEARYPQASRPRGPPLPTYPV